MAEPGIIMTQSSVEEYLKNKNRYSQTYKNIENQLLQGIDQLEQQYVNTINSGLSQYGENAFYAGKDLTQNLASIYDSAAQQRYNLITSDIGSSMRTKELSDLESVATKAYDSYLQNYMINKDAVDLSSIRSSAEAARYQGIESLYQNATNLASQVTESLESEAKNYQALYNTPREYLQYLVDNDLIGYDTPGFERYFDKSYVDGELITMIKSAEDLDSLFYNFDESGNVSGLSDFGKDFYNQMLYGTSDISGAESFFGWLNANNPDLYNWAIATNPYNTNTTNLGDVFSQLGLGNMINKGTYTPKDYSVPATHRSNNAIDVDEYNYEGTPVWAFNNVEYTGLNTKDASELKSELFSLVDKNGNKYSAKLKKGEKADDNVLTAIVNTAGSIEDGKLYAYGKDLYLAVYKNGSPILRKVTINDDYTPFRI